jgi:uncharacterized protein (UPF0548 family)
VHGRELGHELVHGDADRAGDVLLLRHLLPDQRPDLRGPAQAAQRAGHVEERLVQGQRLDLRGHRLEDGHDLLGDRPVQAVPGRDDDGLRAQAPGPADRHRRVHAVGARLVGRRQHHAPARRVTDDDRAAMQFGPVPDLHAGEERVHVDVQDAAAGVVLDALRAFLRAACVALGTVQTVVSRMRARTAHVSPASEYLRAAPGRPRSC